MSRNLSQATLRPQTLRRRNSEAALTDWGAGTLRYRIVGMTNSAPSLVTDGQRAVTVLVWV